MSARAPRRSFAAPFVVTLAACSGSSQPTHPLNPPMPMPTPQPQPEPQPQPQPTEPTAGAPDAPAPGPATEPATFERHWRIIHAKGSTDCQAIAAANCPKPEPGKSVPTCNPPPPMKYACPDGLAEGDTLQVVLRAGATECFVDYGPMKCPPAASCNPPRPRKLACPGP